MPTNMPTVCLLLLSLCLAAVLPQGAVGQMIVAHRGASHDAPENTLAAFQLAWQRQADAVEGDFYLSADGKIVCIHDDTTKRTARINLKVAETNLVYLQRLDVGEWKGRQFAGQRIPTLDQVLATVPPGKKILIEVKCGPEIVTPLRQTLEASSLSAEQTIVIAFDARVVAEVKRQLPQTTAFWLTGFDRDKITRRVTPTREQILHTLAACGADGLDCKADASVVDAAFVSAIRAAGYQFHVWTVNDPRTAAHFAKLGVDSITTDRPLLIRQTLAKP